MWRSLLDSVVEAFAMCDPVAYMHYIECKRLIARQAAVTRHCDGVHRHVDQWVDLSERIGWRDYEDAEVRRHRNETPV